MIDISRYLNKNTLVWPGDTPFNSEQNLSIEKGNTVNLCAIHTSTHNGTHADAPWHYDSKKPQIDAVELGPYIGPCVVVDAIGAHGVEPDVLERVDLRRGDRVLFRTSNKQEPVVWEEGNAHLSINTVIALSNFQCPLVGIDTSSVDPSTSTTLEAHHALGQAQIMILENLLLSGVEPGRYVLVALPLKLQGLDASPVRAVLLSPEEARGLSVV